MSYPPPQGYSSAPGCPPSQGYPPPPTQGYQYPPPPTQGYPPPPAQGYPPPPTQGYQYPPPPAQGYPPPPAQGYPPPPTQGYPPPPAQGYPPPPTQGYPPPPTQGYPQPAAPNYPTAPGGYTPPTSSYPTPDQGCSRHQQGEARAGDTYLLSLFSQGNVVILQSNASGKSLRINDIGDVQGTGGRGQFAQFRVHVRRPGVVALQNVHNSDNWLAIYQGRTIGTGTGDPFCDFLINEIEGRYVCLESVKYPGTYVGILPDGCVKPPENTKTGPHGRFIPSVCQ